MVTRREFLVSKGLAKEGRGKFSAEAVKALADAEQAGMVFDLTPAELAKKEREEKPKKARKEVQTVERVARPSQDTYDAKAVRSWGEQVGMIEKGKRGKLPTALINAYLAQNTPKKSSVVKRKSVKREAVRTETVGWTFARRGPKDPAYISEPLVAVTSCGGCARGVSYCSCTKGPTAPKYLGGEVLLLTRPGK